ncbi:MAG: YHS domain-containing protein [Betaproteobacteria bacterium]|nr:YHS domain-containing protein [Betaproteobacteria bacterium]
MAKDPICGMSVDEKTAQHKSEHEGQTYYFCSPGCKRSFDRNPEQFVKKE